jgi:hypothetical protein
MINGSSPSIHMSKHGSFKMVKVMFVKVEFVKICVKYVYESCYS